MADFQSQAMGLTGLPIDASSTAPSRAEFSTFLNDGVIDVTDKYLRIAPLERYLFQTVSSEQTSNGLDINGAKIIGVIRESGTDNDWRDCAEIHPSRQGQARSSGSLYLATSHNPVYTILDNGEIHVLPSPDSSENAFKVYYVNNSPVETDGTALDHASTGIKFFPKDKIYLVVLFASIRSLQNSLSAVDISTFSSTAVSPVAPSIDTISYTDATNADASNSNALSSDASATSVDSVTALAPSLIDVSGSAPGYTPPVVGGVAEELTVAITTGAAGTDGDQQDVSDWWEVLADYIEDSEDIELASSQIQKISTYIQAYSQAMQNQLNEFNEANVKYQMEFQEEVNKANQDLQVAIANANNKAQEKRQEAQQATDISKFNKQKDQTLEQFNKQQAQALDQFNKSQDQSLALANAAKQMDKLVQGNNHKLAKFQSDLGVYQAEVNKEVTSYQQEISEKSAEYQWKVARLQDLKQEYNQTFAPIKQ